MLAYLSINQLWNLITFGIMCQFHTEFTGLCLVCIISPSCTWTCGGAGVSSLTLILSPCCVLWHGSMPICVCLCVRVSKKETGGRTVAQMCLKHFKANEARRQWTDITHMQSVLHYVFWKSKKKAIKHVWSQAVFPD